MTTNWDSLSDSYEEFQIKEDSLDRLVDYPAQLELIGDIKGKRILDVACGSGRKALDWAKAGASEVVGFDISHTFVDQWKNRPKPDNLSIIQGDLSNISDIKEIKDKEFDIVTCFQALGFSTNINKTFSDIHQLLNNNGDFILTTAHPFRFVIEKMEAGNQSPAEAYRDKKQYSYPSTWDDSVTVSHSTFMISTLINSLISNQFKIEKIVEPDITQKQKVKFPHKEEWMKKYFGMIGFRCKAV